MQPEHRGYSRCSDFFMCVRHGAHESITALSESRSPRRLPRSGHSIIIFGKITAISPLSKNPFTNKLISHMIFW